MARTSCLLQVCVWFATYLAESRSEQADVRILFLGNRDDSEVATLDAQLMPGVLVGIEKAFKMLENETLNLTFSFKYYNSGDSMVELHGVVDNLLETYKPCLVIGPNHGNDNAVHDTATACASHGIAHVPSTDMSSATYLDNQSFPTSHSITGASLGAGAAMPHLLQFASEMAWKRIVLVAEPSFSTVWEKVSSLASKKGIHIQPIWIHSRSTNLQNDILTALRQIRGAGFTIIWWFTAMYPTNIKDVFYVSAIELGLTVPGMQWFFGLQESPETYIKDYLSKLSGKKITVSNTTMLVGEGFYRSLQVVAARYERDNPNPPWLDENYDIEISQRITATVLDPINQVSARWGPTYKGTKLETDCPEGNQSGTACKKCVSCSKGNLGYKLGLHAVMLGKHLAERGLCSSVTGSSDRYLQLRTALENFSYVQEPYSRLPLAFQFQTGTPSLMLGASLVMIGSSYPPNSLWNLSSSRAMGYFSRDGGRYYDWDHKSCKDLDTAAQMFDNSTKRLWQSGTIIPPKDFLPDSCGDRAIVKVSILLASCTECPKGRRNPLNGSNVCSLTVTETCRAGFVWNAAISDCTACVAGRFANSTQSTECVSCEPGSWSSDRAVECLPCSPGRYTSESDRPVCDDCPRGFRTLQEGSSICYACYLNAAGSILQEGQACTLLPQMLVSVFAVFVLASFLFTFALLLASPVRIRNITLTGSRVHVETCGWHFLLHESRFCQIRFSATHIPMLDKRDRWFRSSPLHGKYEFALRNLDGSDVIEAMETSVGFLHFATPGIMSGVWGIPGCLHCLLLMIPVIAIPITENFDGVTVAATLVASVSISLIFCAVWFVICARTPLSKRIAHHRKELKALCPNPVACKKGGGRAVSAGALNTFWLCFRDVIQHRNMYYIEPNIIKPLTCQVKLSYSELSGPKQIQWFISHYWGLPFACTIAAIKHHAVAVSVAPKSQSLTSEPVDSYWTDATYWCCTFSNNQWDLDNELGGVGENAWKESSFFLALRSGICKGTVMIIDEEAKPLTRSWCLFELLQTFLLSQEDASFEGLLLCTNAGVMNYGSFSMDVAHAVGNRLATLKLQDAKASCLADKLMIDSLVEKTPGGFEEVSKFLTKRIGAVIQTLQGNFSRDLADLEVLLIDVGNTDDSPVVRDLRL